MVSKYKSYWLIALFCLGSLSAQAADISVQTDRAEIGLNESFTLTFSAQGQVDAQPDFSPLQQDFEIAGTSQSSSFNIINGRTESRTSWIVTVFPQRAGTLTVPPIRFGADESPELQIEVKSGGSPAATENKEIFITVEPTPKNPYVQAQTIVTARLYRAVNMTNENLSQLEFSNNDVIMHALDDGKNYQTNLNGRTYNVHERQYAVFAQQPGPLTIKPLRYSGSNIISNRNFFDFDPFGSRRSGHPIRLQSEPVTLNVRPATASPWLPANSLKIDEKWSSDPAQFRLGEPLTRKLRISAGGLSAEQLPELPAAPIDGFKQYPDQPSLENRKTNNSITGIREESIAFMPTRAGTYTLPAVEIKWWNTRTGTPEIARLPERTVTVAPAGTEVAAPEQPPVIAEPIEGYAIDGSTTAATDIRTRSGIWFWLSLILALGWLSTLYAWWRQHHSGKARAESAAGAAKPDTAKAERMLEQACRQQQPDITKDALLAWARAYWPQHPPANLEAIATRSRHEPLSAQLHALDARLYAPGSADNEWNGKELWQAFSEYKKSINGGNSRKEPSLPPLHKI